MYGKVGWEREGALYLCVGSAWPLTLIRGNTPEGSSLSDR